MSEKNCNLESELLARVQANISESRLKGSSMLSAFIPLVEEIAKLRRELDELKRVPSKPIE